jgi:hypothetical protein
MKLKATQQKTSAAMVSSQTKSLFKIILMQILYCGVALYSDKGLAVSVTTNGARAG